MSLALEVALNAIAALQYVALQLQQRQRLPDQNCFQSLKHGVAIHVRKFGQALARIRPLQVLITHAFKAIVLSHDVADCLEIANAHSLEAALLPNAQAVLLQELGHDKPPPLLVTAELAQILGVHLLLRALLHEFSHGQCLPDSHGFQQLCELVLGDPPLLWAASALVPLHQILHAHLVNGFVLVHQLYRCLVPSESPHRQALCLELQLMVQALAQPLEHGFAAVIVHQPALPAIFLELFERQAFPHEHVAKPVNQRLRIEF
mmetsp:Transcript_66425/g.154368  ORF Transcript_66425/g.154368 Transcript_66425/m.154368 type:complete len:262 (-) Transcript_66425:1305-2090(-)